MASRAIQTLANVGTVGPCSCVRTSASAWALIDRLLSNFGGHQVNQRENEHPDQIDKVPVQTGHFHILGFELPAHHGLRDDRQVNQADGYVRHVQPGERKESAAKQWHAPGIVEYRDML